VERKITLFDLADALGVSTGTVHRALHDHRGVSPLTKTRVQQMAKSMGYRPNLAARYLSRRRQLRISVNTLKGTTSFWDEVGAGIQKESQSLGSVELEFRTYPRLGEGEAEAFEEAVRSGVNGIIPQPATADAHGDAARDEGAHPGDLCCHGRADHRAPGGRLYRYHGQWFSCC